MKFYVTTPIYYSNAKPHIGSAYPTIAADVLARYHQQQGDDTFFLTGTAEHGQKIATYAAKANKNPQEFVDATVRYFTEAWQKLDIKYSDFIRTTEPRHKEAVKIFFEKLKSSGQIYEKEYEGLYCIGHEAYVKESDLNPDGLCPDHQTKPEPLQETNWFFKLSEYEQPLLEAIKSGQFQIEPQARRNEVISFIEQGLEDIAISRQNVKWAIPLPWDESQTIYVWLDELFNYCSAIGYQNSPLPPPAGGQGEGQGEGDKGFQYWWPADVHIVGKDIIKFHCIIWPALLMAIGEALPKKVVAHGFFTVDGQKISKSLGNAIDPVALVDEYGADAIRYFLLREIPFGADGDFSHDRLKERYNADLANGLGNLVSRTLNMIEKFSPSYEGEREGVSAPVEIQTILQEVDPNLTSLHFDKALEAIWQTISWADELIEKTKPWELAKSDSPPDKRELEGVLKTLYATLQAVNIKIAPFLPETHTKLTQLLTARPLQKPSAPLFARKD